MSTTNQTDRPATLTPAALAQRWGCSTASLANRRSLGMGPAYVKPVGRVVYLLSDIEAYELASRVEGAA